MPESGTVPAAGVVAALPGEARALAGRRLACGARLALDSGVLLAVSGIGRRRAADAAADLVGLGARGLVSWGIAAGLDPALAPGRLVLPDRVLRLRGALHSDAEWRARIAEGACSIAPMGGGVADAVEVVATPEGKARLRADTGAAIADMETAAVAEAAARAGVPWVAVRVVADPASMCVPPAAMRAISGEGRLRPFPLLLALARAPSQARALRVLGRSVREAFRVLGWIARTCGPALARG